MKSCGQTSVVLATVRTLAFLLLAITPAAWATSYYSQSPGRADLLTCWNSNTGGGGSTPANFTSGDTFVMQSGQTITNGANWTVSGGATIQINSGALWEGSGKTMSVGGNLVNNGTIQSLVGTTTFTFTSASTYSGTGTIFAGTGGSSRINWLVNVGSTLTMGGNYLFANGGIHPYQRNFTVNGTIDCGNYTLTGGGGIDFILGNGATFITANTNGINGSILNFGTNGSFSSAASYVFNGGSAQVAGVWLPGTVTNLTINNAAGVTLVSNLTVTGAFTLTNSSRLNLKFPSAAPVTVGKLFNYGTTTLGISGTNFVAGQDYPLLSYTNRQGAGGFALGALPAGMAVTLVTNGNTLVLRVTSPPTPVVVPPVALVQDTGGGMHLGVNSVAGYSYKVSASTNLVDWNHLVTVRGQDVVPWSLPAVELAYVKRFFRADKVTAQGLAGLTVWTNFQAAAGARLQIGMIGDSYTQNRARYTKRLKQTLAAQYGDLGAGFLGFASYSAAGLNGSVDDTQLNYTIAYTNWTTKNGGGYGPDAGHVTSLSNNASLTIQVLKTVETNKLYYVNTPGDGGLPLPYP